MFGIVHPYKDNALFYVERSLTASDACACGCTGLAHITHSSRVNLTVLIRLHSRRFGSPQQVLIIRLLPADYIR